MSSGGDIPHADPQAAHKLYENEAKIRSGFISKVSYKVSLHMKRDGTYRGSNRITFSYSAAKRPQDFTPFLDFTGKVIHKFTLNGQEPPRSLDIHAQGKTKNVSVWTNNRLYLDSSLLKDGENVAEVSYTNDYDKTGAGLHCFEDPEDKEIYVYSNFEPYDCHLMIPCFDQPDIKAPWALDVVAPADWKVIANSPAVSAAKPSADHKDYAEWKFEATPAISTYLFAVVGGPFEEFNDVHENGNIPLGMYCRKTLVKYLDEKEREELFTVTKQGLDFFGDFFGLKYPFKKYDQVFCPEFNAGAMENPGCVTFTEHYIFRDAPTLVQRINRADTFLHEMAHMWFGNLVTMKWWNGLWLNESFATYMAALAVAECTKFGASSWVVFGSSLRQWAMDEDELDTTHPIEGKINDTSETFLNFDGITYGKGACTLKQLVFLVGMDQFKAGMQYYFQKYKWGNTTVEDFLHAIQEKCADEINLDEWEHQWLRTSGPNTLTPVWSTDSDGKIKDFDIKQEAPEEHPTLRTHKVEIAMFDSKGNLAHQAVANVKGDKSSVAELVGRPAKDVAFTWINYGDHGYGKFSLGERSIKFLNQALQPEFFKDDLLTKQAVWNSAWAMVRDRKLSVTKYLSFVREALVKEDDSRLVDLVRRNVYVALYAYTPDSMSEREAGLTFAAALNRLSTIPATNEVLKTSWAKILVAATYRKEDVERMLAVVDKNEVINGYSLDQALRWDLIEQGFALGLDGMEERLQKELERDPSDIGKQSALACRSAWPSIEAKEAAWSRYTAEKPFATNHMMFADMRGFQQKNQAKLLEPFVDKFFGVLRQICNTKNKEYAQAFLQYLKPPTHDEAEEGCTSGEKLLARWREVLRELETSEQPQEGDTIMKRPTKDTIDRLSRALAIRAFAKQNA